MPTMSWQTTLGLSVRTENVLHAAGLETPSAVRDVPDEDILRMKNAGRRVLAELYSRGLRHNSCPVPCTQPIGHAGDHTPFVSPFTRAAAVPTLRLYRGQAWGRVGVGAWWTSSLEKARNYARPHGSWLVVTFEADAAALAPHQVLDDCYMIPISSLHRFTMALSVADAHIRLQPLVGA